MEFRIDPYSSVGDVRFGMSREEVRGILGGPSSLFRRSPNSVRLTEAFSENGIFVIYDDIDRCAAVEMTTPASAILEGRAIISQPMIDVQRWLELNGAEMSPDSAGFTCFSHGIGIFAPAAPSPFALIESVIAFNREYGESRRRLLNFQR